MIGAPPFALDHLRSLRDFAGIGQAAVALQHPFGILRRLELVGLDAALQDLIALRLGHAAPLVIDDDRDPIATFTGDCEPAGAA